MLLASFCSRHTTLPLRQLLSRRAFLTRAYSMSPTLPTITLNPNEQRLAKLLVECADWVDEHPEEVDKLRLQDEEGQWIGKLRGSEKTELRIAGGWVRDKVSAVSAAATRTELVRFGLRGVRKLWTCSVTQQGAKTTPLMNRLTAFHPKCQQLLGRESDDIDVSTSPDPITGLKFAMLFEKYLESVGHRELVSAHLPRNVSIID